MFTISTTNQYVHVSLVNNPLGTMKSGVNQQAVIDFFLMYYAVIYTVCSLHSVDVDFANHIIDFYYSI